MRVLKELLEILASKAKEDLRALLDLQDLLARKVILVQSELKEEQEQLVSLGQKEPAELQAP